MIRANIIDLKEYEFDQLDQANNYKDGDQIKAEISDITQVTKSLTQVGIMHLAFRYLDRNISIDQTELKLADNSNEMIIDHEDFKNEYADCSFGLKNRVKYEKLSEDQINFLKKTINDLKLTTRQIQSKYNVFYSVLNRIKRCDKSLVLDPKRRKLVILNENQKLRVINCIKKYIQNRECNNCKRCYKSRKLHSKNKLFDKVYYENYEKSS